MSSKAFLELNLMLDNMKADLEDSKKLMEAWYSGEIKLDDDRLERLQKYAEQKEKDVRDFIDMLMRERDRRAKEGKS